MKRVRASGRLRVGLSLWEGAAVQQCWRVVMGAKRLASVVVLCDVALCVGWERVLVL